MPCGRWGRGGGGRSVGGRRPVEETRHTTREKYIQLESRGEKQKKKGGRKGEREREREGRERKEKGIYIERVAKKKMERGRGRECKTDKV